MMPLQEFLAIGGRRLHVYFTLEYASTTGDAAEEPWLPDSSPKDLESILEVLRTARPGMTSRHASNANIVHLIDRSFSGRPDYVMEQRIDLDFTGTLADLPDAIGQRTGHAVASRRLFLAGEIFGDWITQVTIRARQQRVRDILTDAVPLARYGSLLWNADTTYEGSARSTTVQYYGPAVR